MAHVPLVPIGVDRSQVVDTRTFDEYSSSNTEREDVLAERRTEVHGGWGQKYVDRVHKKGKLTSRERIALLIDEGTEIFEVGTFVNYGLEYDGGVKSPAAGVVTAFAKVHGRWCMVIANDNTVASGAWWPRTPEKIQRAQTMALRLRLPTVYLVDCSGLFLPEQSKSFPGARGAGHIFKMNSLLSDSGVPQLAGVFGDCIAGGGYMPIISDRVYMTEQAYMVIAGAALIKGAKSQKMTSLGIGGPEVHVHQSGCADVRVPDDETLIHCLRREVANLASSASEYHRGKVGAVDPGFPARELTGILPTDHRESYDAKQVLARLVDHSLFWELMPDMGTEMICGIGRVGGLYTGFIINRQGLVDSAEHPGQKHPAGILYKEGIAKISAFSRACNDDGIPLIWLQDISGFDIGKEAERLGLLSYGSNLIYSNSTNTAPMFTVLLRKASGAGYYAMAGAPYDPIVQLSTCLSRQSVMEGRTLAIAAFNTKLDENFEITATDPAERAKIANSMQAVEERIEADMDPYVAARQMDTDEIVPLGQLRAWIANLVDMSYQSPGYRRIKNPRIWSMHDLHLMAGATSDTPQELIADTDEDGNTVLKSPTVGHWISSIPSGQRAIPGMALGELSVLGRNIKLLIPAGVRGIIADDYNRSNVEYGQVVATIGAIEESDAIETVAKTAANDLDGIAFVTPSSGRFYLQPAPDKDPFAKEGDVVIPGQTIFLLEVMKTFSRITYGGAGLPEKARILRILPKDGDDLSPGQTVFVLEKIA